MPDKMKKLQEMIQLVSESLTRDEFLSAFSNVIEYVKKIEKNLSSQVDDKTQLAERRLEELGELYIEAVNKVNREADKISEDNKSTLSNVKAWALARVNSLVIKGETNKLLEERLKVVDKKIQDVDEKLVEISYLELPNEKELLDKTAKIVKDSIDKEVIPKIPTIKQVGENLPEMGESIRDGLELLQGNERLAIGAIKDLNEELEDMDRRIRKKTRSYVGGGGGGSSSGSAGGATAVHVEDDVDFALGNTSAAPNAKLVWDTTDANANLLKLVLPEGGATDVPVFMIGDTSIDAVDVGLFNGVTAPTVAMMSPAGTKALYMYHDESDGHIKTTSGDIVLTPATGYVGVGTAAPTVGFHIRHDSDAQARKVRADYNNTVKVDYGTTPIAGFLGTSTSHTCAIMAANSNAAEVRPGRILAVLGKTILGTGVGSTGWNILDMDTTEVTTTDATETTAATQTLTANTAYHIRAMVVGVRTDDTQRSSWEIVATVYRQAGNAVIQGTPTVLHEEESNPAWNVTLDVSGTAARVRVTGVAATSIKWGVSFQYFDMT